MKKPRLEAFVAMIIGIISFLAIVNFGVSEYESNCQEKVLFLQANNTEFFYRASVFSNAHVMAWMFAENFNKSKENINSLGETFNLLQEQAQNIREKISSEISKCSKFSFIKNLLFITQLILSGIILYLTISLLQKTKS